MMNHGIKIAKPGFDVKTTSKGNLVFDSGFPVLKMRETGNGVIVLERDDFFGNSIVISTHDLGYKPKIRLCCQWYDVDSASLQTTFREAPFADTLVGGSVFFLCNVIPQDTDIVLEVAAYDGNGSTNFNLEYFYTIYYDEEQE